MVSLRWLPAVCHNDILRIKSRKKEEVGDYMISTIRPTNHKRHLISLSAPSAVDRRE